MENIPVPASSHDPALPAVLVTGGAKRVGREIALHFARRGHDVALHYGKSSDAAEKTRAEIAALGRRCVTLQADLGDLPRIEGLMIRACAALPHLGLLVNSASAFPAASLAETDGALLEKMFAIHLHAPILLSRQLARHRADARIVMIGDTEVLHTNTGHFAYLLSKKALMEATRMLARALAPHARVNAVCPGPILAEEGADADGFAHKGAQLPFRANAQPSEVADMVYFLATQQPLSGQILYVDAGAHLL